MKLDDLKQSAAQKFAWLQDRLLEKTEALLSARKRRKLVKKEKQKRKNQIVDWVQALLWAACVVLLVNQYLVQAYAIPTGSMEDTIIGEDRIFVDKMSYGPELVPGALKFPGFTVPRRGEIVVFVNPDYQKDMGREVGWFEQFYHRLVYMLTFTFVNLDVKPNKEVAHHFLVKRLIGAPGDQLRMRDGRVQFRPEYETTWVSEDSMRKERIGRDYTEQKKFFPYDKYMVIRQNVVAQTLMEKRIRPENLAAGIDVEYIKLLCAPYLSQGMTSAKLTPAQADSMYKQVILFQSGIDPKGFTSDKVEQEYQKVMLRRFSKPAIDLSKLSAEQVTAEYRKLMLVYNLYTRQQVERMTQAEIEKAFTGIAVKYIYVPFDYRDQVFEDYWYYGTRLATRPHDYLVRNLYMKRDLGWYIPHDRFFPMGDNRDNSRDARFFNAVKADQALGRSMFRFWPIHRIGGIE